ncbi:MAG: phosphate signaling complex protein PhoU [Acholeplasma sp.]|nr:phosphate signaling complex protein PhoU [Acholeplasma sp.]
MTAMRKGLEVAIEELRLDVLKMTKQVIANINDSLEAFKNNDSKLANEIIKRDDDVDKLEEIISKDALKIIWKEQPVARDLRFVTGILKLITDLERIGDHATDIAEITLHTTEIKNKRLLPITLQMADIAKTMVFDSTVALFKIDVEMAKAVIATDDQVDEYFNNIVKKMAEVLKEEKDDPEFIIYLLMVAKYIERIADHAVNIAEWVIFISSGEHKNTPLF